jgi:alcohol dehydrogenase class IV
MPIQLGLIRSPRTVVFAEGARHSVGSHASAFGTRALLITDRRFATTTECAEITASLRDAGVEVTIFDETAPEIPSGQVARAVAVAASVSPDMLVAVGGGSCIDLAKVTATVVAHGGSVLDYVGEHRIPGPGLPVIALPTTAGTGSEVTAVAVVLDEERQVKTGLSSPHLIPEVAIVDPELTYTCPPGLTAAVGADALAHLVESFCAIQRPATAELAQERVFIGKNELTDLYSRRGVELLRRSLRTAVVDPSDRQARRDVALASLYGGYALSNAGTAGAHALQYPIGAATHTPHGVGVGLLLPHVLRFIRDAAIEPLAELGEIFGAAADATAEERADHAIAAIAELLEAIDIPRDLRSIGVEHDDLDRIAAASLASRRLIENSPRPIDEHGARTILDAAYATPVAALKEQDA